MFTVYCVLYNIKSIHAHLRAKPRSLLKIFHASLSGVFPSPMYLWYFLVPWDSFYFLPERNKELYLPFSSMHSCICTCIRAKIQKSEKMKKPKRGWLHKLFNQRGRHLAHSWSTLRCFYCHLALPSNPFPTQRVLSAPDNDFYWQKTGIIAIMIFPNQPNTSYF